MKILYCAAAQRTTEGGGAATSRPRLTANGRRRQIHSRIQIPNLRSDTDSEPVAQTTLPFIPPPCFTADSHDQHHLHDISWNTRRLGSVGETLTGNGIFTVTPPERPPPSMSPDFSYPELSTLNGDFALLCWRGGHAARGINWKGVTGKTAFNKMAMKIVLFP
ncbi:hypothetical protein CesoFtcFv8_027429 [Champsocephalus esox]|uniref:Uncharacterized protein n=1 Tax=Champsocephalus esox TaxID=159716 RepID=A0AAN7YCY0_9TELE|nr:hypothetical protein CesoFtcFv8_027429 [Champsocephalus esox]